MNDLFKLIAQLHVELEPHYILANAEWLEGNLTDYQQAYLQALRGLVDVSAKMFAVLPHTVDEPYIAEMNLKIMQFRTEINSRLLMERLTAK